MRRNLLAVLSIVCLFAVLSGCRQTTTGFNGTQLTPVNPLAPNQSLFPAPGSSVGPMGGSTRVPPPPTGSVGASSNPYLGGAVAGQVNPSPNFGAFAAAPSQDTIGSGVQNAGWTETGASVSQPSIAPAGYNDRGGPSTMSDNSMTRGGMQVIDLTASAPPIGAPAGYPQMPYQPMSNQQSMPNQQPMQYQQQMLYPQQMNSTAVAPPVGAYDMNPLGNDVPAPLGYGPPRTMASQRGFEGPQSLATSAAFENVNQSYAPAMPQAAPEFGSRPTPVTRQAPAPRQPPSTDPAPRTAAAPSDDLMWRRPGTGF